MSPSDSVNVEPGSLPEGAATLDIKPAEPPDEDVFSIDHYEILRLGPQADEETIERVYRTLAGRFHSNGPGTGDAVVLRRIRRAYETLSNPAKRARYNALRERTRGSARFRLRDREFFDGVRGEQNRRLAVLCLLYRQRVGESPGLSLLDLEQTTGCTREELGPALWYLCEKKWAKIGDGAEYRITAAGFDVVESKLEERDAAKLWAWLYPEDTGDNEFIYASARPSQPVAQRPKTASVTPESPASNTAANIAGALEKHNSKPAAEVAQAGIKAEETPASSERKLAALVLDDPPAELALDPVQYPTDLERIAREPIPIAAALGFTEQVTRFGDGVNNSVTAGVDTVASESKERDVTNFWAWLYPDDTGGNEFASPKERPTLSADAAAPEKQNSQPVTEAAQAETKACEPAAMFATVLVEDPAPAVRIAPATAEPPAPAESMLAALIRDELAMGLTTALVEYPAPAEGIAQEPISIEAPRTAKQVATSENDDDSRISAAGFEIAESDPVAEPTTPEPPEPAESTLAVLVRDEVAMGLTMALAEHPAPAQRTIPIEDALGIASQLARHEDGDESSITAAGFEIVESNPPVDPATPEPQVPAEMTLAAPVRDGLAAALTMTLVEDPAPVDLTAQEPIPIAALGLAKDLAKPEDAGDSRIAPPGFEIVESNPVADPATSESQVPAEMTLAAPVRDGLAAALAMTLAEDPGLAEGIAPEPIPIEETPGHKKQYRRRVRSRRESTALPRRHRQQRTRKYEGETNPIGREKKKSQPVAEVEPADSKAEAPADRTLPALLPDEPAAGPAMNLVEDPPPAEGIAQEPAPIMFESPVLRPREADSAGGHRSRASGHHSRGAASDFRGTLAALVPDEPAVGLVMELVEDPTPAERPAPEPIRIEEDDAEFGNTASGFEIIERAWRDSEDINTAPEQQNQLQIPEVEQTDIKVEEPPVPAERTLAALVPEEPAAGLAMNLAADPGSAEGTAHGPIPIEDDDIESGNTAAGFEIIERAWLDSEDTNTAPEKENPQQVTEVEQPDIKVEEPPATSEEAALVPEEPAAGLAMNLAADAVPAGGVEQEPIPIEDDDAESGNTAAGFEIIERAWLDSEDTDCTREKQNPQQVLEVEQPDIKVEEPPATSEEAALVPDEPAAVAAMNLAADPVPAEGIAEGPIPIEEDDVESSITAAGFEIVEKRNPPQAAEVEQTDIKAWEPLGAEAEAAEMLPVAALTNAEPPAPAERTLTALVPDERAAGMAIALIEAPAEQIAQAPIPAEEVPAVTKQVAVSLDVETEPNGSVKALDIDQVKPAEQPELTFEPPTMLSVMESIPGTTRDPAPKEADRKGTNFRAFGLVLLKVLAGLRLFVSNTVSALAKVQANTKRRLRAHPREDLKPPLTDDRRFQSPSRREQGKTAVARRSRLEKRMEIAAVLLAVSTVALLFFYFYEHSLVGRSVRYQIPTPGTAAAEYPALSPDGRHLAFVASKGGPSQLWVLALDTLESRPLSETSGASYPFWSPDGAYLGFFTHGKLRKIAIAGGLPETLCDAPGGRGGAWNRNGLIVFSPGPARPIFSVPAAGGVPTRVTKLAANGGSGAGHRFPVFLPDGLHFLYTAASNQPDGSGVFVGSLDGAAPVRLLPGNTNALYAPPAKPGGIAELLFRREKTLMAQPFDATALKIAGEMLPVAEQVQDGGNADFGAFSVSDNGMLAFRSASAAANGDESARVDQTGTGPDASAVSPDKKSVAVQPITVVTNWYRSLSP